MLGEALGLAAGDNEKDDDGLDDMGDLGSEEEEKQLQNMMYNLMVSFQCTTKVFCCLFNTYCFFNSSVSNDFDII